MIDLHTHSSCSDGSLTPTELVARAGSCGVEVLALTDHDTVDGLDEAARAAAGSALRLVPGVEVSASWRSQSIHILGLWIDPGNAALRARLGEQAQRRRARMRGICSRLDRLGLPGAGLLAAVQAQPGLPTRAHLAKAMVDAGIVSRADDAFRKYLGKGRGALPATDWPDLATVVGWIKQAGGTAALAHPARYPLSSGGRRQLLESFAAAGGAALEVVTGGNGAHHVEAMAGLAVKHGFLGSVGSDFHHPDQTWNPLGRSLKLPDCVAPVWRNYIT